MFRSLGASRDGLLRSILSKLKLAEINFVEELVVWHGALGAILKGFLGALTFCSLKILTLGHVSAGDVLRRQSGLHLLSWLHADDGQCVSNLLEI